MKIQAIGRKSALLSLLLPCASFAQEGEWLVAPYIWAADVSWDLEQRGSGSMSFSDVVDKLDAAGMIRVEFSREKFGLTFDYIGMDLSDGTRISIPGTPPIDVGIQADIDLQVFEAGAFYRPTATDSGIDYLAGIRNTDVDSSLIVTPANSVPEVVNTGKGVTDFFVGARYLHRFSETWDFSIRGDYGAGGSEGAINLMGGVGWRSSGAFGMSFAYRHLEFDIDQTVEGEAVTNSFSFSGPAVGFLFRF